MAGLIVNAVVAGLGGAAAVGAFGVALIQIGVGLVFSAVAQALQKKQNRTQTPGIRTKFTGQGDVSPQTMILGLYATAGHMMAPYYTHSRAAAGGGDNNFGAIGSGDYATFVINLSDTAITDVTALYLDGVRFDVGTHLAGTAHPHYGTPVASGVDRNDYVGKVWLKVYDGTQTAADPYLLAAYGSHPDRPWKATSWHRGGAYAIVTVKRDTKLFRGIPTFRFEVQGMPLYDPRDLSTAYSVNPALMCWNVLRGIALPDGSSFGMGVAEADLPTDWWDDALDECEVQVENQDGGDEDQYRAGIEIPIATPDDGGMDPLTAIDELLPAMSAQVADLGGQWIIRVGAPGLAVASFDDGDVLNSRDQTYRPFVGLAEKHNCVAATFPSPAAKWEPIEAPLFVNQDAVDADGEQLIASLDLDTVPYPDQVQRLAAAWGKDAERRRTHIPALAPYMDSMTVLDTVDVTSARFGYSDKSFEINRYVLDLQTGVFQIAIREVDHDDWTVVPAEYQAQDVPNVTRLPAPALAITTYAVAKHQITDGTDDKKPAIRITWTPPSDNLSGVAWQVYRSGELVIEGSTADADAGEVILSEGLLPDTGYSVRIKPLAEAQATTWTSYEAVTTDDIRPITSTADFADGLVPVEIVATLPTTGNYQGRMVFLTTDDKLYRHDGSDWIATVEAGDITGELTDSQIADLDAAKLTGQITGVQISDNAVTAAKIDAGAVTTAKIAANAVTANEVAANAITAAKIDAGAVTTAKLAAGAVTANELATNSIVAGKIATGAITSGMGVFSGPLQSDDFVTETSGWQITKAGNAEFNQLIVRESLVDGAVSDGVSYLELPEQTCNDSEVLYEEELGEFTYDQLWHISITVEMRRASSTGPNQTRYVFQIAYYNGATWDAWQTVQATSYAALDTFQQFSMTHHIVANRPNVRIRVFIDNSLVATPTQTNVRNIGISAKYVAR
ncbi:hypothetical protein [Pseudooceanicola sp.]|uniref:hypothetical protein n=1 Tax=Pseudooceanicola sp. TaxID=1914328 RepID=UPI0035C74D77